MKLRTFTCRLGPTSATLVANDESVLTYLRDFYTLTEGASAADEWLVEAIVGPADDSMTANAWGVSYSSNPLARRLRLRAPDPASLAITARKSIREALVDYCEQRRYVMLHASAVVDDQRVIIVVGDKGSGKTPLGLKTALFHGKRYLSNDHLIVYPEAATGTGALASRLALTSLPTPIPLKIGTYLDLEHRLPPPWDTEGLDIDAHRAIPRDQLYGLDQRVLYTFAGLGQDSPITVNLADPASGPAVLVVLASYTNGTATAATEVADQVEALMPHVRTDWVFDPSLNQRYLPRHERQPAEYEADARRLVAALAERATVIQWDHRGDPAPLLDHPRLKVSAS